jgi:hypothetical protein
VGAHRAAGWDLAEKLMFVGLLCDQTIDKMGLLSELRELSRLSLVISFVIGFVVTFLNGLEVVVVLLFLKEMSSVPNLIYLSLLSLVCFVIDVLLVLTVYSACCWKPRARLNRLEAVVSSTGVNAFGAAEP